MFIWDKGPSNMKVRKKSIFYRGHPKFDIYSPLLLKAYSKTSVQLLSELLFADDCALLTHNLKGIQLLA